MYLPRLPSQAPDERARPGKPDAPRSGFLDGSISARGLLLVLLVGVLLSSFPAWKDLVHAQPSSSVSVAEPDIHGWGAHMGSPPSINDPARELLENIADRDFQSRSEVVTDRLRQDFDRTAAHVEKIDVLRLHTLRRGNGWVQVRAPLRSEEAGDESDVDERRGEETFVELRLVRQENVWKLDRLRVLDAREEERS